MSCDINLRQLLSTLNKKPNPTTTSYSKVSRGLHFPLEVPGLCARRIFREVLIGDSEDLVTPFMQVVN